MRPSEKAQAAYLEALAALLARIGAAIDAHADAVRLKLPGVDTRNLEPRLLAPTDLAISKLGRFSPVDRSDIEALAREGLLKVGAFRARAQSALGGFVGNTERLAGTIDIACRLIEACQPRET